MDQETRNMDECRKPICFARSGIAKFYQPENLVGKNIIVITNLEPRIMMGMESQGMVLAVLDSEGKAVLISPEREVSSGTTVS